MFLEIFFFNGSEILDLIFLLTILQTGTCVVLER